MKQAYEDATGAVSVSIEKWIEPYGLQAYGWQAVAQLLMGDVTNAAESLREAHGIISNRNFWPALYISSVLLAQFMLDLQMLKGSNDGKPKSALISGKKAVKNCKNFAAHRSWIYRLMGEYYLLVEKRHKALEWFESSIKEAKRLGARPDFSRTYFEVEKCLMGAQSKYIYLNYVIMIQKQDMKEVL